MDILPTNEDLIPLSDKEFTYIATLMYNRFGIHLSDQKRVLVAGRLSKRIRQLGFTSFTQYIKFLESDTSGAELSELVNRITTNHSYFFREQEHFEFLTKTILPALESKQQRTFPYPLRIWSAGCATGEEIFSIGMLLQDYYGSQIKQIDCGLLATDISLAALEEAGAGRYAEAKVKDIPATFRSLYFHKIAADIYEIRDDIRKMVLFKRLNLMSDTFPMKGQFDIIFCRNVMIYFDQDSRAKLVNTLYRYIKPGGYFFIGHSESLKRDTCPFDYVKPAIYKKGDN